jgi:predicted nucleic acid-binding protein
VATTGTRPTLVDANVLIDVVTDDPTWRERSEEQLALAMRRGTIGINPIVYAELAPAYSSIEALDRVLADLATGGTLQRWALPWEAAYRAGRAFLRYPGARSVARSAPRCQTSSSAHTPRSTGSCC